MFSNLIKYNNLIVFCKTKSYNINNILNNSKYKILFLEEFKNK